MQARRTGASLVTRVHPLPGADHAVVEAVVRLSEPRKSQPIDLEHPGFGPLDRCLTELEEAAITFLAENGKPTQQLWTGRGGRRLRLTVTATWSKAEPGDALLWSELLENPIAGFRNQSRGQFYVEYDEERYLPVPVRRDLLDTPAAAVVEQAGITPLELEVLLVPAGAPVTAGEPPPEGARTLAGVRALVLEGLPVCFNSSRERLYVLDWDVEVAQAARVPDPIIGDVQEGHFLEAEVARRGTELAVRLDLELLRLVGIDRIVSPLDMAQSTSGVTGNLSKSGGSIYTGPSMPQNTVAIEHPVLHSLRITSELPLDDDGTATLRRSASGFTGEAKDVVVVVRVEVR